MTTSTRRTRRAPVLLGVALAATAGSVVLAPTAGAAPAQVVPSQCPPVPAGYVVQDHSALPSLGTLANPYFVPGNQLIYTVATPGPDVIEGNSLGDVICTLDGDDVVDGNGGDDVIHGLRGSDSLHGNEAADELVGGLDDDTLFGDGPVPTLFDTNDTIKGGQGDDVMFGGAGNDRIVGNAGTNTGSGDAGIDSCTTVDPTFVC
jgi:hypothetical protein